MQNEVTYCNNQSFENDIVVTQKTNCKNENNENNNLCIMCNQTKIKNRKEKLHELLTVDFARYNRANNGDKMNTQFNKENFEQNNSFKTQKGYSCNKVSVNNKNKSNVTYKKQHNILQSTVILLSWLFVFIVSVFLISFNYILSNDLEKENFIAQVKEIAPNGNGTLTDPYIINCDEHLQFLSNPNNSTDYWKAGVYFKQTKNITFEGNWVRPIGIDSSNSFNANYDGCGNTITISTIEENVDSSYAYFGLFGYTDSSATIQNLGVISNFNFDGSAIFVGGIVGYANSTKINNCFHDGVLDYFGSYTQGYNLGGITGYGGIIKNCYNSDKLYITGYMGSISGSAGGISGENATIENCYNTGSVSYVTGYTNEVGNAGGIIGNGGSVTNCYNTGDIVASNAQPNGIGTGTTQYGTNLSVVGGSYNSFTSVTNSWDKTLIWGVSTEINGGHPYLRIFYQYTITFDKAGGIGGTNSVEVNYGQNLPDTIVIPSQENYNFIGYFGSDGTKYYDENGTLVNTSFLVSEDLTLIAQWELGKCQITFNIKTNVGAIFTIYGENNYIRQVFVQGNSQLSTQSFSLSLSQGQYKVVISTFYTTNIQVNDTLLANNVYIFNVETAMQIDFTLNSFVGNNGIII